MPPAPLVSHRPMARAAALAAACLFLGLCTCLLAQAGIASWPTSRSVQTAGATVESLALLIAAALTAWCCLLSACAGVVLIARVDFAHRVGTLLAPRVFPRLLAIALGTTVALSASPAHAAPLAGTTVAVTASEAQAAGPEFRLPAATPAARHSPRDAATGPTVPLPGWGTAERWTPSPLPSLPPAPVALVTGSRDPHPDQTVTVVRGDCLWDLAAAQLGPNATAAEIAGHTSIWHELNRAVIGDDPDLLQVGTVLQIPPAQA